MEYFNIKSTVLTFFSLVVLLNYYYYFLILNSWGGDCSTLPSLNDASGPICTLWWYHKKQVSQAVGMEQWSLREWFSLICIDLYINHILDSVFLIQIEAVKFWVSSNKTHQNISLLLILGALITVNRMFGLDNC